MWNLVIAAVVSSQAVAAPQDVSLTAADGTALHAVADLVSGSKTGVVMVHMDTRTHADWRFVSEKLVRGGMSTMAMDLRGHGQSARAGETLAESDYLSMEADVEAAVGWLREQGVESVSCLGASLGANLCLRVAAKDPKMVNLVLLSPALKKNGLTTANAMVAYGDRPVLIVASMAERYDGISAEKLNDRAKGQHHMEVLADAGHGTKMLNRDPTVEGLVLAWLMGTYELAAGTPVRPRPIQGEKMEDIKTTGTELDL